jgi:hypothetical protein
MRWDDLFNDLEGQLERELSDEEADIRAEEERLRLARLGIRERLMSVSATGSRGSGASSPNPPAADVSIQLVLRDASHVVVSPTTFGRDWFTGEVIDTSRRASPCVVPLDGIASVIFTREQVYRSLDEADQGAERSLSARLGLGFVLRDLCRRRTPLDFRLTTGTLHGTIDRVGRDHCDLAVHDAGGVRRESSVTGFRLVPFSELLLVRL